MSKNSVAVMVMKVNIYEEKLYYLPPCKFFVLSCLSTLFPYMEKIT